MRHQSYSSPHIQSPRHPILSDEPIEDCFTVPRGCLPLLTHRGVMVHCDVAQSGAPDASLALKGIAATVRCLHLSNDPIFTRKHRTLVDIGCGDNGSDFALALEKQISGTSVSWVDHSKHVLSRLQRPAESKFHACASDLPFPDRSFNLAFLGYLGSGAKLSDRIYLRRRIDPTGAEVVTEAARILSPGGLLFTDFLGGSSDPAKDLKILKSAGFVALSHIYRILWAGFPHDLYALRKERAAPGDSTAVQLSKESLQLPARPRSKKR